MVIKLDPGESFCDGDQNPKALLKGGAFAVSKAPEGEGSHHDHMRTRHAVARFAGMGWPGVCFSAGVLFMRFLTSLSPLM